MRRFIGTSLALCLLAGCAGGPEADADAAFTRYWQCAHGAAMAHAADTALDAQAVAMRAQADCYGAYEDYKTQKTRHVRSVVPAHDRAMAVTLAESEAFERRKDVTARLRELVIDAR